MALIWLVLASFLHGEEELSIEAFWLGPQRFREEVFPQFDDKMPELKMATIEPEESRFINAEDVLWDLRERYMSAGVEIDAGWIVYNETTGYLVAKAGAIELGTLELRHTVEHSAKIFRLGVEVFEVDDQRVEWIDWKAEWEGVEKELLFGAEVVGRSGGTQTLLLGDGDGLDVSIEVQMTSSRSGENWTLRLALEIEGESQECVLNSSMDLEDGERSFLEMGSVGGGGSWVVGLTPELVLVGGPSQANWHLFEKEEARKAVKRHSTLGDFELRKDGEYHMVAWRLHPNHIADLSGTNEDPFAASSEAYSNKLFPPVKKLPAVLTKYYPREQWLDLTKVHEDSGLSFGEGEFAYYGQLNELMIVRHRDRGELDLVDQMWATLGSLAPNDFRVAVCLINEKDGERELVARTIVPAKSGETGSMIWSTKEANWDLEVQPTMGAGDCLVDYRLAFDFDGDQRVRLNTFLSYMAGHPQEYLMKKSERGSLILRVEIMHVDKKGQVAEEWEAISP